MKCDVAECSRERERRTWCNAHYRRWVKYGDPLMLKIRPANLSPADAFHWFMPGEPPAHGCWDWPSEQDGEGYGVISFQNQPRARAHRVSYEIYHGLIPEGLFVLHACDRPICVHPRCLSVGTSAQNMREAAIRGRMTRGENQRGAKLSEDQVRLIKVLLAQGQLTQVEISKQFNVTNKTISYIKSGRLWGWLDAA